MVSIATAVDVRVKGKRKESVWKESPVLGSFPNNTSEKEERRLCEARRSTALREENRALSAW